MKLWTATKKIVGNFLLIILAIAISIPLTIIAFLWKVSVSLSEPSRSWKDIVTGTAAWFLSLASSIDKFGNTAFGGFFNRVLLRSIRYSFGHNHETISEVVGWNYAFRSLNTRGDWLYRTLNKIEKDHCELAIVDGVTEAILKLDKYRELSEENPYLFARLDKMVAERLKLKTTK